MRSRALVYNIEKAELKLVTNEEFVSHYTWKSKEELLIFSEHKKIGQKYYLYNLANMSKEIIGDKVLNQDGHPTFIKDGKYLLTDTYPNENYYQELIIYDFINNKTILKHEIPSYPVEKNDYRCDLHPRINNSGNLVCIDSNFRKNKSMVILKISI
jgi:hypothetical protein